MVIKELKVLNELGIHARVACRLVRCAGNYKSSINAKKGSQVFDMKNILGVMMINAKCGEMVTIQIDGEDESIAAQAIQDLFSIKFGEK